MFYKHRQKGISALEIIIGLALISLSFLGIFSVSSTALKSIHNSTQEIKASFLDEEGLEAIKILRDTSWQNNINGLSVGTNYYLTFNNSIWQATSTNVYIDGVFERSFILENVYRDANDDIASLGTLDAGTKKITVLVSWISGTGATTTKSISTYLTNLFNN